MNIGLLWERTHQPQHRKQLKLRNDSSKPWLCECLDEQAPFLFSFRTEPNRSKKLLLVGISFHQNLSHVDKKKQEMLDPDHLLSRMESVKYFVRSTNSFSFVRKDVWTWLGVCDRWFLFLVERLFPALLLIPTTSMVVEVSHLFMFRSLQKYLIRFVCHIIRYSRNYYYTCWQSWWQRKHKLLPQSTSSLACHMMHVLYGFWEQMVLL